MILPNGLVGLLIADVSGKGLPAAVHTAMAKYMLEGFACEDSSPASALSRINRVMYACPNHEQDTLVTAFFGVIEPNSGRFRYANAGHPAPLWRHSSGCVERLDQPPGPPLGTISAPDYQETEIAVMKGDNLVLYTDGVIETRRSGQWFNIEGLEAVVGASESTPTVLVSKIYEAVSQFVGGRMPDDIGLLAVRFDVAGEDLGL
ncbi:MAG: serine/threonine-protein phosphatase [Armatimonadetes bacterium]|nr:serine/threonine-protein phosphatase [Armatimonadota bacterium]